MYRGKKILITGGTGSLGNALTRRLLDEGVDTIRIFSRNENKQITMESKSPVADSVEKFSIDNMKKIILNSDLLPK
jgi:FlaA1/EpsC-like NDP-sugar epimerase